MFWLLKPLFRSAGWEGAKKRRAGRPAIVTFSKLSVEKLEEISNSSPFFNSG
jgi:hypothetical protein